MAVSARLTQLLGVGLIALAIVTNESWLDRHILPSFYLMRTWYVALESAVRLSMFLAGATLIVFARPRLGRAPERHPGSVVRVVGAAVLAIVAGALVLRWAHPSNEWLLSGLEPRRQPDARLGWTFVPNRASQRTVAGRTITYAFDSLGARVRSIDEPVDPDRPTMIFIGESVMFGEGLLWEETIPARVGAAAGVQTANLAVHGYASDQAYLRLEQEWPRFRQPIAVVSLFMTALLGRNLDENRPHLGPGLVWMAPIDRGRLVSLAELIVPFRRTSTVERGIAVTQEVFRATVALARARGATPVIVVPQLNREDDGERTLRRRILDEGGVPYVFVELDEGWRLPGELHPNARAADAIASAVTSRLRGQ
jgi:hypothetical protein